MKIGYVCSFREQEDDTASQQVTALEKAGCQKIFSDLLCRFSDERSNLELAIEYARAGDILVIWHISCLAPGVQGFVDIAQILQRRNVGLLILTGEFSDIKPHSLESEVMLEVFSLFANLERKHASRLTKDGLERTKAQGQVLGRRSKFEQWKPKLIEMKAMGYSQGEISRSTGLAYNTVKAYLQRIAADNKK